MEQLGKKIEKALSDVLEESQIDQDELQGAIFVTAVSETFTGMDEAERQRLVWSALQDSLTEDERSAVEFVATIAPGERRTEHAG